MVTLGVATAPPPAPPALPSFPALPLSPPAPATVPPVPVLPLLPPALPLSPPALLALPPLPPPTFAAGLLLHPCVAAPTSKPSSGTSKRTFDMVISFLSRWIVGARGRRSTNRWRCLREGPDPSVDRPEP